MNANCDLLLRRAVTLHNRGDLAAAALLYREILHCFPNQADALHLLGVAETQLGRAQHGMEWILKSLAVNPDQPAAVANLGNALLALNRAQDALASYDRAAAMWPEYALAILGRGNALMALEQPAQALASFERVLERMPDFAEALNSRGNALLQLKRREEAVASFDRALEVSPDLELAHCGRGHALLELGKPDAAIDAYGRALQLNPALRPALLSRGVALSIRARFAEAADAFGRLQELDPHCAYAPGARLHAELQQCEWSGYAQSVQDIVSSMARTGRSDFPFSFLAVSDSPDLQLRCAREFSDQFRPRQPPLWSGESYAHPRIRVAYISGDFLEHPTSYLIAGLLEKHDRTRFETIGISLREDGHSATGRRVRATFEREIVAGARSDAEVAQVIRGLEVDVAVDLMGYTGEHRTNLFAHRAAPVQVNYLGFPGTLGAADIDYIIADDFLIPPERRADYSEQVVYLPDCFQANDDEKPLADAPTRREMGLPDAGFVWCSFHSSYKINPVMFDIWMRLLRAVPGSALWLAANSESVERNLRREAEHRGLDARRLVFARSLPYPQHLARLRLADLCLDTLPFNGGATTSDALWAGVPVVTCAGKSFAARMSGSLLHALNMRGLVTGSLRDYECLALQLAAQPVRLAEIRAALWANRLSQPLFDTERFARHIEAAYTVMVDRVRRRESRADLRIAAITLPDRAGRAPSHEQRFIEPEQRPDEFLVVPPARDG